MPSMSEESIKIENQDEVMVTNRSRDTEKATLTNRTSRQHGGNRVLSSRARSKLIAIANQVKKVT